MAPEREQLQRETETLDRVSDSPRLTPAFVGQWLECVCASFGYGAGFPCARVRTFMGAHHLVCVPLLPYAHLDASDAAALAEQHGNSRRVHVRHVAPLNAGAPAGTPVVSVIPLFEWRDAGHFWSEAITSNLRKRIRKAEKDGYAVERSSEPAAADGFYTLFCATMHRHGTPPFPLALFKEALARGIGEVVNVRRQDITVVSYFVLKDPRVALFMWAGFDPREDAGYASLLGEWESVRAAFERNCRWFDLGRAPLGGPAWRHKQYWRPRLFHATCAPPPPANIYARYAQAARIWRCLPAGLARRIGPWIVRHLPDA
ncbi:MAG: GNAT family N-acetyltransferase [Opitutaceae bacterium]